MNAVPLLFGLQLGCVTVIELIINCVGSVIVYTPDFEQPFTSVQVIVNRPVPKLGNEPLELVAPIGFNV